jgi:hypothetical protein
VRGEEVGVWGCLIAHWRLADTARGATNNSILSHAIVEKSIAMAESMMIRSVLLDPTMKGSTARQDKVEKTKKFFFFFLMLFFKREQRFEKSHVER